MLQINCIFKKFLSIILIIAIVLGAINFQTLGGFFIVPNIEAYTGSYESYNNSDNNLDSNDLTSNNNSISEKTALEAEKKTPLEKKVSLEKSLGTENNTNPNPHIDTNIPLDENSRIIPNEYIVKFRDNIKDEEKYKIESLIKYACLGRKLNPNEKKVCLEHRKGLVELGADNTRGFWNIKDSILEAIRVPFKVISVLENKKFLASSFIEAKLRAKFGQNRGFKTISNFFRLGAIIYDITVWGWEFVKNSVSYYYYKRNVKSHNIEAGDKIKIEIQYTSSGGGSGTTGTQSRVIFNDTIKNNSYQFADIKDLKFENREGKTYLSGTLISDVSITANPLLESTISGSIFSRNLGLDSRGNDSDGKYTYDISTDLGFLLEEGTFFKITTTDSNDTTKSNIRLGNVFYGNPENIEDSSVFLGTTKMRSMFDFSGGVLNSLQIPIEYIDRYVKYNNLSPQLKIIISILRKPDVGIGISFYRDSPSYELILKENLNFGGGFEDIILDIGMNPSNYKISPDNIDELEINSYFTGSSYTGNVYSGTNVLLDDRVSPYGFVKSSELDWYEENSSTHLSGSLESREELDSLEMYKDGIFSSTHSLSTGTNSGGVWIYEFDFDTGEDIEHGTRVKVDAVSKYKTKRSNVTIDDDFDDGERSRLYFTYENIFKGFSAYLPKRVLDEFQRRYGSYIDIIENNSLVELAQTGPRGITPFGQETASGSGLWGLDDIDGKRDDFYIYNEGTLGSGVTIYIVDDGISKDINYKDRVLLYKSFLVRKNGCIFYPLFNRAIYNNSEFSHGTSVANITLGTHAGVAKKSSLAFCKLEEYPFPGKESLLKMADVYKCIDEIINHNSLTDPLGTVINISIGISFNSYDSDSLVNKKKRILSIQAFNNLSKKGYVLIHSAGNESYISYPYNYITKYFTIVGAYNEDGDIGYSNYGSNVNIYAPGFEIDSSIHGITSTGELESGTSLSAPIVAGAMARYQTLIPYLLSVINDQSYSPFCINSAYLMLEKILIQTYKHSNLENFEQNDELNIALLIKSIVLGMAQKGRLNFSDPRNLSSHNRILYIPYLECTSIPFSNYTEVNDIKKIQIRNIIFSLIRALSGEGAVIDIQTLLDDIRTQLLPTSSQLQQSVLQGDCNTPTLLQNTNLQQSSYSPQSPRNTSCSSIISYDNIIKLGNKSIKKIKIKNLTTRKTPYESQTFLGVRTQITLTNIKLNDTQEGDVLQTIAYDINDKATIIDTTRIKYTPDNNKTENHKYKQIDNYEQISMKLINTSWYNNSNGTGGWLRGLVFSPDGVKQVEVNDDTEVWNNDGSLKREDNIICGKDFPNNGNDGFLQSGSYYTHERITPRFFCMIGDIRLNKRNGDNLKIKIINDKGFEKEISLTLSNSGTASVQNKPAYKNFSTNDLNNIISKQNQEKLGRGVTYDTWVDDKKGNGGWFGGTFHSFINDDPIDRIELDDNTTILSFTGNSIPQNKIICGNGYTASGSDNETYIDRNVGLPHISKRGLKKTCEVSLLRLNKRSGSKLRFKMVLESGLEETFELTLQGPKMNINNMIKSLKVNLVKKNYKKIAIGVGIAVLAISAIIVFTVFGGEIVEGAAVAARGIYTLGEFASERLGPRFIPRLFRFGNSLQKVKID